MQFLFAYSARKIMKIDRNVCVDSSVYVKIDVMKAYSIRVWCDHDTRMYCKESARRKFEQKCSSIRDRTGRVPSNGAFRTGRKFVSRAHSGRRLTNRGKNKRSVRGRSRFNGSYEKTVDSARNPWNERTIRMTK